MMRDANIVTLCKNRGARRDCNNYQGISLLSIAMKLFAPVVLKGLEVLAPKFYRETSCGFLTKRSTLLGLIAYHAQQSIRSVWRRLRRNGHKHFVKSSFWEPLSSRPSFFFFFLPSFFCPFSSKAEPVKFKQSYNFNNATCNPLSTSSSYPDVLCFEIFKMVVQRK